MPKEARLAFNLLYHRIDGRVRFERFPLGVFLELRYYLKLPTRLGSWLLQAFR
jgi:hypothetical protein